MRIEWDPTKDEANQAKHGIDFETAQRVFDDPYHVVFVERVVGGEVRWHAIGVVEALVVLVVVHTHREDASGEVVRIVSARRASRRERKLYAEAIG